MSLQNRIKKLEDEYRDGDKEVIVGVLDYRNSVADKTPAEIKKIHDDLSEQIASQRAEGKKMIVVLRVPYDYERPME